MLFRLRERCFPLSLSHPFGETYRYHSCFPLNVLTIESSHIPGQAPVNFSQNIGKKPHRKFIGVVAELENILRSKINDFRRRDKQHGYSEKRFSLSKIQQHIG